MIPGPGIGTTSPFMYWRPVKRYGDIESPAEASMSMSSASRSPLFIINVFPGNAFIRQNSVGPINEPTNITTRIQ